MFCKKENSLLQVQCSYTDGRSKAVLRPCHGLRASLPLSPDMPVSCKNTCPSVFLESNSLIMRFYICLNSSSSIRQSNVRDFSGQIYLWVSWLLKPGTQNFYFSQNLVTYNMILEDNSCTDYHRLAVKPGSLLLSTGSNNSSIFLILQQVTLCYQ